MSDEPAATAPVNQPEARTDQGVLKDQTSSTPPPSTETKPELVAKAQEGEHLVSPDAKPEDKTVLGKDGKPETPAGAPEKYEAFTVPEGFKLDDAVAKEAGDLFKKLNIPQEGAQSLVDFYLAKTKEAAEAPYKQMVEMRDAAQKAVKADPEIGGKLAQVKENVGKALDSLGDPKLVSAFREAMDLTGAGDQVAIIKVMNALASRVTEGSHVSGSGPSPHGQAAPGSNAKPSAAQALYPNLS